MDSRQFFPHERLGVRSSDRLEMKALHELRAVVCMTRPQS